MITESVLEQKQKAQEKRKKYCHKNLKKRKNEGINTGDYVLIYNNTHKRSKGTSLKPRFKGPYTVQDAKKDSFEVQMR